MAVFYLTEQQAWVKREGDCLVVHIPERSEDGVAQGKRERKMTVPLFKIEEVMVFGDITLTTPALTSLLDARVSITYLSSHGRYLGQLSPALTRNSLLRLTQHAAHTNSLRRHALVQRFVIGKLRNMKTLLMRYQRSHPEASLAAQVESLQRCVLAAEQTICLQEVCAETEIDIENARAGKGNNETYRADDTRGTKADRMHGLGSLLRCEGAGSAAYFGVFGQLIRCGWEHGFCKRTRRPPTDPVNALLSYGYVILTSQVASVLASVGFDPYIGYLHSSSHGKPALDLMEEFRPVIVDSVVISLFNNRQLEQKGFRQELNSMQMTEATKRLFLQKFEERMQETIKHPVFGYSVSYRRCIELQARLLGKYLTGEVKHYTPFVVR